MLASAATTRTERAFPAAVQGQHFQRACPTIFYEADSEIYAQGEVAGGIFRVEFGAVRIYRLLADGRRQIVAFHVAGETFGFEAGRVRGFFAESIVATGLISVDMELSGQYSPRLMDVLLQSMIRAQGHLLVVGRQQALEKIAVFLLDLSERQGGFYTVDLVMSRTDIADYLGMTIETVSRSISKLRSLGILRLKTLRSIEILKPERLWHLSQ